jgi:hypothetical protein
MKRIGIFVLIAYFLTSNTFDVKAQKTIDSAITFPMFSASYMVQFPGGDMADRFGVNSNIGGSFMLKLKNNLFLDINANYIFGNELKGDAAHIFDSIETEDGAVINKYGEFAKIRTFERGYFIGGRLGMVLPIFRPNLNSGPLILLGGGILQHKIRIENDGNNAPQINNDYKFGYDKMSYGFCASEFIGYIYFSKKQFINCYIGIEFYQGFTKSGRSYDFSLMKKDTKERLDLLYSIKFGWIVPVYKRMPDKYYYY